MDQSIPLLETIDFEHLVQYQAKSFGCTESDMLKFISRRPSLQSGLELLGVPLFSGCVIKREKERTEALLESFECYLVECGYNPPTLKWEPIGLTNFDPVLNEDVHRIAVDKRGGVSC